MKTFIATATAAAFALGTAVPAVAQAVAPAISPAPGTPDANPQTQISVFGVPRAAIESVSVTGSISGAHGGVIRAYSGGQGASFIPARPFDQGERVFATVRIRGQATRHVAFTVATLGVTQPVLKFNTPQLDKLQRFVSEPTLLPPKIAVLRRDPGLSGDIFLTPLPSPIVHPGSDNVLTIHPVGPAGPMIVGSRGQLVWFDQQTPPGAAADLELQRYHGQQVLTWWQGGVTPSAFGIGEGVIANHSYRTIAIVHAGNGYSMDIHEFRLTPAGDALFTVYSPILVHLPGTPAGSSSPLLDSIVQEVDIRTGLVVWEWHSYGHVPLSDSYATPANSTTYDAYHLNALQPLPGGRILISARDTSAVYDVDQATDRIVWTLGGKASSFRLGPGARFYFQHDAEMLPDGDVSLFDDEAGPPTYAPTSRGLLLSLNLRRRTASLARQFHIPQRPSAQSEGSYQTLSAGSVFLGFGSEPYFSQLSATGKVLFTAQLPNDDGSYRAFRFDWNATPTTRPAVVVQRGAASGISVYVSWNGATAVRRWQLLAGASASALKPVGTVADTGFETRITFTSEAAVVVVRALDARGKLLRASLPAVVPVPYAIASAAPRAPHRGADAGVSG